MTLTLRGVRSMALLAAATLLSLMLVTTPGAEAAPNGPRIDPKLTQQLSKLSVGDKQGAFVHFEGGTLSGQRSLLRDLRLTIVAEFPSVDAIYAAGPATRIKALFDEPSVDYLEANRGLSYSQETSRTATRSLVGASGANGKG